MSKKTANTEFNITEDLANRWSPRAFGDKIPEVKQIEKLIEAASWSPSCFNEQPWRFIIGVKGKGNSYDDLFVCLNEFNQEWAKSAPVLMIVCAKKNFSHNDKPNKHYQYDAGAAMSSLCTQATADGLYVHQMAGFFSEKAEKALNIPNGFEALTAVALGFLGDPDQLSEKNKESELAERNRKPLDEVSFLGKWGSQL